MGSPCVQHMGLVESVAWHEFEKDLSIVEALFNKDDNTEKRKGLGFEYFFNPELIFVAKPGSSAQPRLISQIDKWTLSRSTIWKYLG